MANTTKGPPRMARPKPFAGWTDEEVLDHWDVMNMLSKRAFFYTEKTREVFSREAKSASDEARRRRLM